MSLYNRSREIHSKYELIKKENGQKAKLNSPNNNKITYRLYNKLKHAFI